MSYSCLRFQEIVYLYGCWFTTEQQEVLNKTFLTWKCVLHYKLSMTRPFDFITQTLTECTLKKTAGFKNNST